MNCVLNLTPNSALVVLENYAFCSRDRKGGGEGKEMFVIVGLSLVSKLPVCLSLGGS